MTIEELKKQEAALLSSNRSSLKEYGRAYQEIIKRFGQSSAPWLSDDVLISDIATVYIKDMKHSLQFSKDEKIIQRIRGASKLIVKDFMPREFVLGCLKELDKIPETFEEAREALQYTRYYSKIRPEVLKSALDELNAS